VSRAESAASFANTEFCSTELSISMT
jgi:hypothetical protein